MGVLCIKREKCQGNSSKERGVGKEQEELVIVKIVGGESNMYR